MSEITIVGFLQLQFCSSATGAVKYSPVDLSVSMPVSDEGSFGIQYRKIPPMLIHAPVSFNSAMQNATASELYLCICFGIMHFHSTNRPYAILDHVIDKEQNMSHVQ